MLNSVQKFGPLAAMTLAFCCASACSGTIITPGVSQAPGGDSASSGGGSGGSSTTTFDPGATVQTATPPEARFTCGTGSGPVASLKKLTMRQITNSFRDLVQIGLKDKTISATVWTALAPAFALLPKDQRPSTQTDLHGSFTRLDQDTQQGQIESLYQIAMQLGSEFAKPERRANVFGACGTDSDTSNDSACLDTFITSFGERVLRHPITADELARFHVVHGSSNPFDSAAIADLVADMFLSPYALAFVEHGSDAVAGKPGVWSLSPYELASELSLDLWETIPDDALWAAAKSGALLTDNGYAGQVDRLNLDPRAAGVFKLFSSEWLRLDQGPTYADLDQNKAFNVMAGGDAPDASYLSAMQDDATSLVTDVFQNGGRGIDLLTSRRSFVSNAKLARAYGVAPWSGSGDPVLVDSGRPGLLGRAFFLDSGIAKTRPIMRGVFIRKEVLCDTIAPPPPNAQAMQGTIDKTQSIREQTNEQTAPALCAACHHTLINGLGFALENFDALGRARSQEIVLDLDTGATLASHPINTVAQATVFDGDNKTVTGLPDLVDRIGESGKVPRCLAVKAFRFTYARQEDEDQDGCTLESARGAFDGAGGLAKGWRALVMAPSFRQRVFQ